MTGNNEFGSLQTDTSHPPVPFVPNDLSIFPCGTGNKPRFLQKVDTSSQQFNTDSRIVDVNSVLFCCKVNWISKMPEGKRSKNPVAMTVDPNICIPTIFIVTAVFVRADS